MVIHIYNIIQLLGHVHGLSSLGTALGIYLENRYENINIKIIQIIDR